MLIARHILIFLQINTMNRQKYHVSPIEVIIFKIYYECTLLQIRLPDKIQITSYFYLLNLATLVRNHVRDFT